MGGYGVACTYARPNGRDGGDCTCGLVIGIVVCLPRHVVCHDQVRH